MCIGGLHEETELRGSKSSLSRESIVSSSLGLRESDDPYIEPGP